MLEVLKAGMLTTVQDRGRTGWARYGVPPSGPMDAAAFLAANSLVGNPPSAAGLEVTLAGPALWSSDECLVAVCGADFELWAGSLPIPTWHAVYLRAGQPLRFGACRSGARAYIAVAGGIEVALYLGSRSTFLNGRFGGLEGRALAAGDRLPIGAARRGNLAQQAGKAWPAADRPAYRNDPILRVVMGPQGDCFSADELDRFTGESYLISRHADRMGIRLEGQPITERELPGIVSDGVLTGSVQIPPDGRPIVMMVDHQTTGGYPKIATVLQADLPLLAQCRTGARVRFTPVTLEEAQASYRRYLRTISGAPNNA